VHGRHEQAARAGFPISVGSLDRRAQAPGVVAELEPVGVGAGIDDDGNAGVAYRLADGAQRLDLRLDVDKVRAATALVRSRRPDLPVEGPIQYDAAADAAVAASKMPGSAVAGRATVFIFPDLNTGNNTYKAVQRSAGAVAIGPVLQGLRKPVNDLSRGALVQDIVNTVAITAIQAASLDEAAAGAGTAAGAAAGAGAGTGTVAAPVTASLTAVSHWVTGPTATSA